MCTPYRRMEEKMEATRRVPQSECPSCHCYMGDFNHGRCEKCDEFCGCSFDPTSANDYCEDHRPRWTRSEVQR